MNKILLPLICLIAASFGCNKGQSPKNKANPANKLVEAEWKVAMTQQGVLCRGTAHIEDGGLGGELRKAMTIAKLKAYAEFCEFVNGVDEREHTVSLGNIGTLSRVVSSEEPTHLIYVDHTYCKSYVKRVTSLFQNPNGSVRYEWSFREWLGDSQSYSRIEISLDKKNYLLVEKEYSSYEVNPFTKQAEVTERFRCSSSGTMPKLREYGCNLEENKLTRTFIHIPPYASE